MILTLQQCCVNYEADNGRCNVLYAAYLAAQRPQLSVTQCNGDRSPQLQHSRVTLPPRRLRLPQGKYLQTEQGENPEFVFLLQEIASIIVRL